MAIGKNKAVLVTACDASYFAQAKQLFSSAFHNGGWRDDALLLVPAIDQTDRDWFETHGIQVMECPLPISDDKWRYHERLTHFPAIVLLRYHLFGAQFRRWDTVVYLDCDIIVMGELERLLSVTKFGAVGDPGLPLCANFANRHAFSQAFGMKQDPRPDFGTFNSGVFAFRPRRLSLSTSEYLTDLSVRLQGMLIYPNQAVMNAVFWNLCEGLPLRCNFLPPGAPFHRLLSHPRGELGLILHFMGLAKPWDRRHPYNALWKRSLAGADQLPALWSSVPPPNHRAGPPARLTILLLIEMTRWYRVTMRTAKRLVKRLLLIGPKWRRNGCWPEERR